MSVANFNFNWFDIFLLMVLLIGVLRGKKHGMSEELLPLLQWLTIIVVAGVAYQPLGSFLSNATQLNLLTSFILCYLVVVLAIKFLFTGIKRAVGEKLAHADTFGVMEYYLGMLAGAIRWFCMLLAALAILHARHYTAEERAHSIRTQQENFGTISFPTVASLQESIFYGSESGRLIKKYLNAQLIIPVSPGEHRMNDNIWKRRENEINEIIR